MPVEDAVAIRQDDCGASALARRLQDKSFAERDVLPPIALQPGASA
jgi:hypothetical protein